MIKNKKKSVVALFSAGNSRRTESHLREALRSGYAQPLIFVRPGDDLTAFTSQFQTIPVKSKQEAVELLQSKYGAAVSFFNDWNGESTPATPAPVQDVVTIPAASTPAAAEVAPAETDVIAEAIEAIKETVESRQEVVELLKSKYGDEVPVKETVNPEVLPADPPVTDFSQITASTYELPGERMNPKTPPFEMPSFKYRNELGLYLNQLGLKGRGVEMGVFQCTFSKQIMQHWQGEHLTLVDIGFDQKHDIPRTSFIEKPSMAAVHDFEDASLDFVYIDAAHDFYSITDDLEVWYEKVKPGGLFCGHDYLNSYDRDVTGHQPVPLDYWPDDCESLTYGVKVAVTRFAKRRGLKVYQTAPDEKGSPSWFIIKPHRFVTTLTENFVPGFIGLLQSMKENSQIEFCFTVVEYAPISQKQKDIVNAMGIHVDWIPKELLGHFEFDRSSTDSPRMAANLNKFLVWLLPHRGPMCYTDVDVLCLNSLRDLINLQPLSVTVMQSAIGKEPDEMTQYRPSGKYPFNAGWFVFERSEQIYRECQEYARTYKDSRIAFGDQVPMNDYWATQRPDQINYVNVNWNISHWCLHNHKYLFEWDQVKLLHFAHAPKPWKDEPTHAWMQTGWDLFKGFYERGILAANKKLKAESGA